MDKILCKFKRLKSQETSLDVPLNALQILHLVALMFGNCLEQIEQKQSVHKCIPSQTTTNLHRLHKNLWKVHADQGAMNFSSQTTNHPKFITTFSSCPSLLGSPASLCVIYGMIPFVPMLSNIYTEQSGKAEHRSVTKCHQYADEIQLYYSLRKGWIKLSSLQKRPRYY